MRKTPTMKRIEHQYGMTIEELFRKLYIDENKTILAISQELLLAEKTVWTWLKETGIRTRKMKWE